MLDRDPLHELVDSSRDAPGALSIHLVPGIFVVVHAALLHRIPVSGLFRAIHLEEVVHSKQQAISISEQSSLANLLSIHKHSAKK